MDRGLIRKTAAVIMSMVMAFGAVSVLPGSVVKDNAVVASAEKDRTNLKSCTMNSCDFYFSVTNRTGTQTAVIEDVEIKNAAGSVNIPQTLTSDGVNYTVTDIGNDFLKDNKTVKEVLMPNTITTIGDYFLHQSSVEYVVLSNEVDTIGTFLMGYCTQLTDVEYSGTKLPRLKMSLDLPLYNTPKLFNEKGAKVLGNWLIDYEPKESNTNIKIADLGNNGQKIDSIGHSAFNGDDFVTTVDLEGITFISRSNFHGCKNLNEILNYDGVTDVYDDSGFSDIPWIEKVQKSDELVRIGPELFNYKTNDKTIDLTKGELAGIKYVREGSLTGCSKADTLICSAESKINPGSFYVSHRPADDTEKNDPLPMIPTYMIKNIEIDGKPLVFSREEPLMSEWVIKNYKSLYGTAWLKYNAEAKTKELFDQLGITYYGVHNDMMGKLSKDEEFYNVLKIHDYLSLLERDSNNRNRYDLLAFISGGSAKCGNFAHLNTYLLTCAATESVVLSSADHTWNSVKIGDEWFEGDDGLDMDSHGYNYFGQPSSYYDGLGTEDHTFAKAYSSYWDTTAEAERPNAARVLGDINSDGKRDMNDVANLYSYLASGSAEAVTGFNKTAADINGDGVIDITDAVLLDNFVYGKATVSNTNPTDGLANGFTVIVSNVGVFDRYDLMYYNTDRDGYFVLPEIMYDAPEGKKFGGWDIDRSGKKFKTGQKVKLSEPYTVIQPIWKDESEPDDDLLGDVDGSGIIDISDVSKLINHINGVKPLTDAEALRADVNKSNTVDISDASAIVNHINGVKAIEGEV